MTMTLMELEVVRVIGPLKPSSEHSNLAALFFVEHSMPRGEVRNYGPYTPVEFPAVFEGRNSRVIPDRIRPTVVARVKSILWQRKQGGVRAEAKLAERRADVKQQGRAAVEEAEREHQGNLRTIVNGADPAK